MMMMMAGVFRLRGHKGPIHAARLLESRNLVVSCSKDSFVKFWDLETQHCVHTIIGHRAEVQLQSRDGACVRVSLCVSVFVSV